MATRKRCASQCLRVGTRLRTPRTSSPCPVLTPCLLAPPILGLETGLSANDPDLQGMIDHAIAMAREAGKPVGCAIGQDPEGALKSFARGFSWTVMGNDLSMLAETAQQLVAGVKSAQARESVGGR